LEAAPNLRDVLGFNPGPFPGDDIEELLSVLMAPTERGGVWGISGNGRTQLWARERLNTPEGFAPGWIATMGLDYVRQVAETDFAYFSCPECATPI